MKDYHQLENGKNRGFLKGFQHKFLSSIYDPLIFVRGGFYFIFISIKHLNILASVNIFDSYLLKIRLNRL